MIEIASTEDSDDEDGEKEQLGKESDQPGSQGIDGRSVRDPLDVGRAERHDGQGEQEEQRHAQQRPGESASPPEKGIAQHVAEIALVPGAAGKTDIVNGPIDSRGG